MTTIVEKTIDERKGSHGPVRVQAAIAQDLKAAMKRQFHNRGPIDPILQESLDMICTKMSRIAAGDFNRKDHWLDIAGYAQLALTYLEETYAS